MRLHNSVAALSVDPAVLDYIVDERYSPDNTENVGRRPCPPLPLPIVLKNVETLHAKCVGGGHTCGLRGNAVKFDLYRDFIVPLRTYRQRGR